MWFLRGPQRHTICVPLVEELSLPSLLHFLALSKVYQFHLIWDLKNCTYSFALKFVPIENCCHDFYHWKFKHASLDLELFAISTYKKNAFQQLQSGLYNEFDSSSFELKVFGGAFWHANIISSWSCHLESQKYFICKFLKYCR